MMLKLVIALHCLIFFNITLYGQEKRISSKNVSENIKNYIQTTYSTASRIKFFQNNRNDSIFIESEFRFKEKNYSLTFYQEILQEEEIEINFSEIINLTQLAIKTKLHHLFTTYQILACQVVNPQTKSRYEITVKHIAGKSSNFNALIFDKSGVFISKSEIILNPISSQF